ncbi:MAG: Crp/Fnr family transcriptional regulator [Aureispira sp.]
MIELELLKKYSYQLVKYKKGEYVFEEGSQPRYYYQVIDGGVKMNYYNERGNEFIQGIFGRNRSFGEPPLFAQTPYPANAVTLRKSTLIRIPFKDFEQLLSEHQAVHWNFTKMLSTRLYYKAIMANGITSNSAEEAILSLFDYIKYNVYNQPGRFECRIELTRKTIAGLAGLTIETTIRKIKEMESRQELKIVEGKVFY